MLEDPNNQIYQNFSDQRNPYYNYEFPRHDQQSFDESVLGHFPEGAIGMPGLPENPRAGSLSMFGGNAPILSRQSNSIIDRGVQGTIPTLGRNQSIEIESPTTRKTRGGNNAAPSQQYQKKK